MKENDAICKECILAFKGMIDEKNSYNKFLEKQLLEYHSLKKQLKENQKYIKFLEREVEILEDKNERSKTK